MTNNHVTSRETMISPEALALLGGGKIAYVKTIRSEDVRAMFPQAPELKPGRQCLEPGARNRQRALTDTIPPQHFRPAV